MPTAFVCGGIWMTIALTVLVGWLGLRVLNVCQSAAGAVAASQPNAPSGPADPSAASLTLEARVIGIDGRPPERSIIVFWRAVDSSRTANAQPATSWREHLNPDTVWIDGETGRTWDTACSFGASDRASATELVPGEYRVTACVESADGLSAIGISEPVRLDDRTTGSSVLVRLEDGPSLSVVAVANDSGKPIDAAQALLVRDNGLTVTPWHRWPWAGWMRGGRLFYEHLAPGRYQLAVGRIPWSYGKHDYAPEQSPIPVVVTEGKDQIIAVRLHAVELSAGETESRWPYVITGHVRDANGKGLGDAAITAHGGMGTLIEGGRAVSAPNGEYTLRFPAFGKDLFALVVAPHKSGFFEKNLHRHGDLLPLWTEHTPKMTWGHPPSTWIVAKKPYVLDFVMLPAARVSGTLLDEHGKPIRYRQISVTGPVLPPASSVFDDTKTDGTGGFQFDDLPTGAICRFKLSDDDAVETKFEEPGLHRLTIQRHRDAKGQPGLLLRRVNATLD